MNDCVDTFAIVGLDYVGLSLMLSSSVKKCKTIGFDLPSEKVGSHMGFRDTLLQGPALRSLHREGRGQEFKIKRIVVKPALRCPCKGITTEAKTGSWSVDGTAGVVNYDKVLVVKTDE